MTDSAEHLLVLNRCPGSITAKKIANAVVAEKLAACVQVFPGVQSYFNWLGKVDTSEEHVLMISTTSARYAELESRIKQLHPYELPEIIAVPISTGLPGYLTWIDNCTDSK